MLDAPPKESELRSWIWVGAGVFVIFCTIPLARTFRTTIDSVDGREYILYFSIILLATLGIVSFANLRRRRLGIGPWTCLIVILIAFAALIYRLRNIPVEALHVAEYGLLGLLFYRALVHRVRDYSVYLLGVLGVGLVGIVDEYIQWVSPSRIFDFRDILTNFYAGVLSQIAIAAGLRPRLITDMPDRTGIARICRVGAAALALLALAFVNTPALISRYATAFPGLGFLLDGDVMAEYGYRYEDAETGLFRSRFSREELQQLDKMRGADVGMILARELYAGEYRNFLVRYSVTRDAYTHEAGVHLYRRNFHLERAREQGEEREQHYAIALRENAILQRYFPAALANSTHHWNSATVKEVRAAWNPELAYESSVSQSIFTRFSLTQVVLVFVTLGVLLLWLGHRLGNSRPVKTDI